MRPVMVSDQDASHSVSVVGPIAAEISFAREVLHDAYSLS
ncbi:hypothetical protein LCGC14_1671200 [marine sediment metagenome]|uniref:Uncharacterized protein n=1 Tax=marine sediment metagenome TaxID=412755 RepID=A0A0F9IDU4_9ZZZZ